MARMPRRRSKRRLNAGDLAQLTEVSRRYFQTKAGYEATLLLGRYQLDQGRPLAAALTLKRVADVPTALAQYDPELVGPSGHVLASRQSAGKRPRRRCWRSSSACRKPKFVWSIAKCSLFARDAAALDWLQGIVGGSRSALSTRRDAVGDLSRR